jgi:hypothetical protein
MRLLLRVSKSILSTFMGYLYWFAVMIGFYYGVEMASNQYYLIAFMILYLGFSVFLNFLFINKFMRR